MRKFALAIAAASAAAVILFVLLVADPAAGVGAGYVAKVACSEIFVAGRPQQTVLEGDFHDISPLLKYVKPKVDADQREVFTSIFGLGASRAVYRDGYGCTLVRGGAPAPLPKRTAVKAEALPDAAPNTHIDRAALNAALDAAFADAKANTRAILVLKDGAVIAERYAPGFTAETPLLSWSMAKSVTATMIGAAVNKGLIDINAPAPAPAWKGDPKRAAITWNNLLHMQSGLAFDESYDDPLSDVNRMLFLSRSTGAVAVKKKLIHEPGTFWSYSSGTANLLQLLLRRTLEEKGIDYHRFAYDAVFSPVGAASFTLEPDSSGTFVGSSFAYATARDWAKLGELYLNDGVANGEHVLPEGWAKYVSTRASASNGAYGAQFWLNYAGENGRTKNFPGLPDDAYFMSGHEGQFVIMIPDKNMVIVRAGMTRGLNPGPVVGPTLAAIYTAVK